MFTKIRVWSPALLMIGVFAVLTLLPEVAHASSTSAAMPWEKGPKAIADSFTGPLGYSLSLIGLAIGGVGLFWGADVGGFAKVALGACFGISLIAFAGQILSTIFGLGALI